MQIRRILWRDTLQKSFDRKAGAPTDLFVLDINTDHLVALWLQQAVTQRDS
jgi:hypothetical protein